MGRRHRRPADRDAGGRDRRRRARRTDWKEIHTSKNILEEANTVPAQRGPQYGHPLDHFTHTAALITAYLREEGLLASGVKLEWFHWPNMMDLDKIARGMPSKHRHRDSLVDRCGYARTIEMGYDEADRRAKESRQESRQPVGTAPADGSLTPVCFALAVEPPISYVATRGNGNGHDRGVVPQADGAEREIAG